MKKLLIEMYRKRYLIMSCLLAFLVIVLGVVIISMYTDNNSSEDNPAQDNAENLTAAQTGLLSGDSNFLVVCNGEKPSEIVFVTLVEFRIYSESIVVTPLLIDTDVSGSTYGEYYAYGGISMLKNAVESTRQCKIDRYVVMDEDGFCDIIDMMGKVPVTVNEEFTYVSSDKSYLVSTGYNEFEVILYYDNGMAVTSNTTVFVDYIFDITTSRQLIDNNLGKGYLYSISYIYNTNTPVGYPTLEIDTNYSSAFGKVWKWNQLPQIVRTPLTSDFQKIQIDYLIQLQDFVENDVEWKLDFKFNSVGIRHEVEFVENLSTLEIYTEDIEK